MVHLPDTASRRTPNSEGRPGPRDSRRERAKILFPFYTGVVDLIAAARESQDILILSYTVRYEPRSPVRATRGYRNSAAIERGPLVFSLRIAEQWRKFRDRPQAPDWEVYPTSAWNYALVVDPGNAAPYFQVREKPLGDYPFSPEGAPVELAGKGRRLADWQIEAGSAGPLPESPVASKQPDEEITLTPYGAAKLRITAFPWVEP
jgi:hypothetical protein